MSSVETVGDTVVVRIGYDSGQSFTFTAAGARWLAEQMIARANDIERHRGPTPTGKQHLDALKALYQTDEATQ